MTDNELLERFGDRLRERRVECKYTQRQLAEKIHVSMCALSSWEQGKRAVSLPALVSLAMVLEVSTDWLTGLSDEKEI